MSKWLRARSVQYSLALAALLLSCAATRVAAQSSFSLQLSTDRGCREDGDDPVYGVGELIEVTFRVDSATRTNAVARLFDVLADGRVGVISFGAIPTNQTRTLSARIGPPTGVEELILQAETASGDDQTRRSCSFRVVATMPGSTATRTPTRTPIPARTMTATPTPGGPTPVPGGALHPHIRTDRGCIESGDQARFNIGDPIAVTFRIDSSTVAQAQAAIRDIFPNGVVKIFSFGTVPTNARFTLTSQVGPPSGIKTLELRARSDGGPVATDVCSFRVGGAANTPGPTRTATVRRTPTPIPSQCVGACTQPGQVTIGDLVTVTQIAAAQMPLSACPSADPNHDGAVSLFEILQAVNNAIYGCP